MKQQYSTQLACLLVLLATLFLAACGGKERMPDEAAIQQALDAANELVYENQVDLAITRLEELEKQAPGNPLVIEAMAFAYAKQPDPAMAAIYFDQAYRMNPANADLALYAAQSHLENGDPKSAASAYGTYLKTNPDDAVAWKALASAEYELKRNQAALDAYLEAFRRSRQTPTHEEAAMVGHLYHAVGNSAQATKWYMQALRPGGAPTDRLTAQLGLFELALRAHEWPRANELMIQIESEFPGELAAGPYASSRTELIKWRTAQNALQEAALSQAVDTPPPSSIPVSGASTATSSAPQVSTNASNMLSTEDLLAASADMPVVVSSSNVAVPPPPLSTEQAATTPKPTTTPATSTSTATSTTTSAIASATTLGNLTDPNDPALAKAFPTETMVDITAELQTHTPVVTTDAGALTATDVEITETTLSDTAAEMTEVAITETETIETTDGGELTVAEITETTSAAGETVTETIGIIEIDPPDRNMTPAQRATLAYEAEDYVTAIRFYRQALATESNNAELSYDLSRAYFNNGQYREAEIYASEATRLSPNDVRFTLNYLRAIQRTMSREALMRELVRAKERFPNSPDITLALGRAYEVIMGNTRNARFLYEEFVTMAPNHPRTDEIRKKLEKLPRY
ncbi:tetratricopeptide repeat protein [Cerasicoccus arenae]|uniref:Tetratricopeptide repeat protein n=1 Tax=Cerasicoccus arenae TaxID=424488 RepID=A0A8J3DH42_9BACT|nr:tetratricopeptide repeat protein [Cerasicoccus arenae]MBK1857080.1 tetratricopeptide repeat protein [Cerasicoccus arenae]GHB92249.1 hypothetical protein GCM10007047_04140 [Cerasicoccus arenae]